MFQETPEQEGVQSNPAEETATPAEETATPAEETTEGGNEEKAA